MKVLLDSGATELVISLKFARKNQFRKKKLDRLIYVRNVDGTFDYDGLIDYTIEVELLYRRHKERREIILIGGQKQNVILGMLLLACNNPEINWKTGEVKITRCLDKCEKWQKTKQMKPRQQEQMIKKQKRKKMKREKKKEFRKPTVEEEIEIARMIEEKQEEEEDLMEIRMVEKMVSRRFHKYLKMFKKKLEKMLTRKTQEHAIDLKEDFVPKKRKIYPLSSLQISPVFFVLKKNRKKRMVQDYQYLNGWTIKNNYSLPLILDLINNIEKKKMFTKMGLR